MRIGIAGVTGRVGRLLVEEVRAAGCTLSGGTTRQLEQMKESPLSGSLSRVPLFEDMAELATVSDVVIDFTHVDTVITHAQVLAKHGVAWVLGTTGLAETQQKVLRSVSEQIAVVYAPNFSPGVALVRRLALMMGRALPANAYDAEIIERHHRQKVDAPSGTALAIGESVAQGRGVVLSDVRESGRDGHCGARRDGAIGFSAVRGGQIVGEHELVFTSAEEEITLIHKAFDRRVFATGAVRAACWVQGHTPGLYGMEDVLGLPPL